MSPKYCTIETKITKYAIDINKKYTKIPTRKKSEKNSNITTRYKKKIKH
jgi:hypothetical protein